MNQVASVPEIPIQTDVAPAQALRELRLRDFRNFADVEVHFPTAGALIIGENGSGKTNLLEAIWYLEVFRSLRGARDDQLVRFGADGFHLRGRFENQATGAATELSVGYDGRNRRKRVLVNGAEAERLSDAIGHVGVVVFSPADVALVSGGPGERRHFLDIVLCLNRRGYMDALGRYRQALRQRNSLLRQGAEQAVIEAYDPGLLDAGATVMHARADWVADNAERFELRSEQVGGRASRMRYRPGVRIEGSDALSDRDGIVDALRESLARNAQRERERGMTLAGPHRDDLELVLESPEGDLDLREYGSGGQQRTAAVALRMVEARTIRESRRVEPIVLLDDVFAEFDAKRSARILELMSEGADAQAVFTAPKQSDVHGRAASLERWTIAAGLVAT